MIKITLPGVAIVLNLIFKKPRRVYPADVPGNTRCPGRGDTSQPGREIWWDRLGRSTSKMGKLGLKKIWNYQVLVSHHFQPVNREFFKTLHVFFNYKYIIYIYMYISAYIYIPLYPIIYIYRLYSYSIYLTISHPQGRSPLQSHDGSPPHLWRFTTLDSSRDHLSRAGYNVSLERYIPNSRACWVSLYRYWVV